MYQASCTAGFDLPEVQFTLTVSPGLYRSWPPDMRGPSSGGAGK